MKEKLRAMKSIKLLALICVGNKWACLSSLVEETRPKIHNPEL